MTWVRFDDGYPWHPKIQPLTDRLYRLANAAIFWCARNLTDGLIHLDRLPFIPTRAKPTRGDAGALVIEGIWHPSGVACLSGRCPAATDGPAPAPIDGWAGWIIHDYFDYQPTKQKVISERAVRAERQRNWVAAKRGAGGLNGGSTGGTTDASATAPLDTPVDVLLVPAPYPPRPAPKEGGGGAPAATAARRGAAAPAGGVEPEDQPRGHSPPCGTCGNALTSAYHRNVCTKSGARA